MKIPELKHKTESAVLDELREKGPEALTNAKTRRELVKGILAATASIPALAASPYAEAQDRQEGATREERLKASAQIADEYSRIAGSSLYVPYRPLAINKSQIRFHGVGHVRGTILKYYPQLSEAAGRQGDLILEYFADYPSENEVARDIVASQEPDTRTAVEDALLRQMTKDGDERTGFFGALAGIAARSHQGKGIITVNPHSKLDGMWEKYSNGLPRFKTHFGILAAATLTHFILKDLVVTRRKFLSFLPFVAAGAASGSIEAENAGNSTYHENRRKWIREIRGDIHTLEEKGVIDLASPEDEKIAVWAWCWMDWRDAASAIGIHKAMETFGGDFDIVQGISHGGTAAYLRDPERARSRLNWYAHLNLFSSKMTVHRDVWDAPSHSFKRTHELPYW